MKTLVRAAATLVAVLAPVASASAATPTATLPPVKQALTTHAAANRTCADRAPSGARGVALGSYRAPMAGFISTHLSASDNSDWDLALFDAASGNRLAASESFTSHELAQTWVTAGQKVLVQGCLRKGNNHRAVVSTRFSDIEIPKVDGPSQLLNVNVRSGADISRLEAKGLDVTHDVIAGQAEVVVHGAKQLAALKDTGLKYTTTIADLAADSNRARQADLSYARSHAAGSPLPSGRTGYREFTDFQNEMKKLVNDHPSLVRPLTIGKTWEGRAIEGVEISNDVNAIDDGKPTYVVVGTHHAREWPAAEAAMEFALLLAQGGDDKISSLLQRERIIVVPVLNIDGYLVSRRDTAFSPTDQAINNGGKPEDFEDTHTAEAVAPGGPPAAYRRKNCHGSNPPGSPCESQYGVDPNRNYGQGWGGAGASSDPSGQTYRGEGPWSEPETQAFWHMSQKRNITALITIHNVAALVLRPPGRHTDGFAPDEPRLKALGDAMADATGYTSQFGWQLYDTSGTTEDWNYAAQGALGYTIEMGPEGGQFHMPYQTGVVDEWTGTKGRSGMRGALLIGAEAAANPEHHAVIKGDAPAGRVLRLSKKFKTSTSKVCGFANPSITSDICENEGDAILVDDFLDYSRVVPDSGHYTWMAGPSTRPFVGEQWQIGNEQKLAEETKEGTMPPGEDHTDVPFTIDRTDIFRTQFDLTWDPANASDIDLEIYWKDPTTGEFRKVASSGNPAGTPEGTSLIQPRTGEYFARLINFAGADGQPYHLKITHNSGEIVVTKGHTEAYTMTCETLAGKVLETKDVTVGRGETKELNWSCGAAATLAQEFRGLARARHLSIASRKVRMSKSGVVPIKLACSRKAKVPCAGVLKVETAQRWPVRGKKRILRIGGQAKFIVKPGKTRVVKLKAKGAARRLILKRGPKGIRVKGFGLTRDSLGKATVARRTIYVKRRPPRSVVSPASARR